MSEKKEVIKATENVTPLYPCEPVESVPVVVIVKRFGVVYRMTHLFREPSAGDKKRRMNALAKTKISGKKDKTVETDYIGATLSLWSNCIISATGYDFQDGAPWKEQVDPDHKRIAVEKLLEECGAEMDEEEAKN